MSRRHRLKIKTPDPPLWLNEVAKTVLDKLRWLGTLLRKIPEHLQSSFQRIPKQLRWEPGKLKKVLYEGFIRRVPRGKKALVFWVFAAVPFITGIIELAANLMQIFAEQLRSSTLSHQNLALEDQFKEHGKAIENLSAKIDTLSILLNKLTPQVDTSVSTDSLQSKDYFPQPTIDRSRYQDELPEQSSQPAPGTSSPDTSFKRQHTIADSLHSTRAKLRLSLERDDSIIDYHFKVTIKKYTPFAVSDLGLSKGFDDPRSPQAVRREIIRRKGQIEGLYRIAIRDTPNLNGSLTCRFTLDKFGEVIAFNIIKSSLNEPRFECQIWESMSRWQGFGIAKDETVKTFLVTYVFGE